MDSFKGGPPGFCYNPNIRHETEETEIITELGEATINYSSFLDIYVHEARNIHNICIYANQDVYAKFSFTSSPDDALSTRIAAGGGKNPRFDQPLTPLRIPNPCNKAVLKVEIWMLSRAKSVLEDQLLGFALIPVSSLTTAPNRKLMQEFSLSSTDLFHSPAGTIRLTLSLNSHRSTEPVVIRSEPSITSEVVILEPAVDLNRIEFPDMNVAKENQSMVMEYFDKMAGTDSSVSRPARSGLSFLQLVTSPDLVEDCEMTMNSPSESGVSVQNSINFTGSSDDRNSSIADESNGSSIADVSHVSSCSPDTPTSKEVKLTRNERKEFKSPLGDVNMDQEQCEMQQQIVDMYMKSMQQFTESLAKMKLPMDLDKPRSENSGVVIQSQISSSSNNNNNNNINNNNDQENKSKNKKDGTRVFYGSRAFF